MFSTYKEFLVSFKDFKTGTDRKSYWQVMLVQIILCIGYLLGVALILSLHSQTMAALYLVLGLVLFFGFALPFIALVSRRLVDAGFSPWLIGLLIIPYLGMVFLFVLNQWPTKKGDSL